MTSTETNRTSELDSAESTEVKIANLNLIAGNRTLLEDASAEFQRGKITLIVGPSGVGKSLLLKILSGILPREKDGIRYSGRIEVNGVETRAGNSGFVFQNFALLDEFSPAANVRFAVAHRTRNSIKTKKASQLLKDLNVPTQVPTSRLSGGQRQRLAIARALAYGKQTIFFDEPTAGLDIGTAMKVAELIGDTARDHNTTAIVVTHDYQALVPIADEIYFLDPITKSLDLVPQKDWSELPVRLQKLSATGAQAEDDQAQEKESIASRISRRASQFAIGTTKFIESIFLLPLSLIPIWKSPIWGFRFFCHFLNLITGVTAIVYLMVAGLILGFVTTFFTFEYLPFRQFSLPLIREDILAAVGFGLYRVVIPVIGTVLIAARCGSAVAADVGSKEYGRQLDAMRSLNAPPKRYLLTNVLYSFLIGAPLLIYLSFQSARWISLVVFLSLFPNESADFWHQHFHRKLEISDSFFYLGTEWVLWKVLICGIGIGAISYAIGAQSKLSSNDVSNSVTRTTLYSTIFVLAVHFVFAFYEFHPLGKADQ